MESRFPGDGKFDEADKEVLKEFLRNGSIRRALREVEKEAEEQSMNLLNINLSTDQSAALCIQQKVKGMLRALDALIDLTEE